MRTRQTQLSRIFIWNAQLEHTTGHFIKLRIPLLSLCWMNSLSLMWSAKIYNLLHPFSIFCHTVLTSLQLKSMGVLSLTLYCHPLWLINPHASHKPPSAEHRHGWDAGRSHSNTTEWPNSITCPIYLFWGPPGGCGSSVNLWSQSIIYSPTCPRALHCH